MTSSIETASRPVDENDQYTGSTDHAVVRRAVPQHWPRVSFRERALNPVPIDNSPADLRWVPEISQSPRTSPSGDRARAAVAWKRRSVRLTIAAHVHPFFEVKQVGLFELAQRCYLRRGCVQPSTRALLWYLDASWVVRSAARRERPERVTRSSAAQRRSTRSDADDLQVPASGRHLSVDAQFRPLTMRARRMRQAGRRCLD